MQSQTANEMFKVKNKYHTLLRKAGLKAALHKAFFFWRRSNYSVISSPWKNTSLSQNEWKSWEVLNHLKANDTWKFWDVLDIIAVTSRTSMWTVKQFTIWSRIQLFSLDIWKQKFFSNRSRTGSVKLQSLVYLLPNIHFTNTWTQPRLELAVYQFNSYLRENEQVPWIPDFLTKPNKRCLLSIGSFMEEFRHYKPFNSLSSALSFRKYFTELINQSLGA